MTKSPAPRRFFSGATLAQATMSAARHYQVPSEELAYRLRDRRHGFTHKQRGVVIEVDPAAPRRSPAAPGETVAATRSERPAPIQEPSAAAPRAAAAAPRAERRAPPRRSGERDADAAPLVAARPEHLPLAAAAMADLVRLAGLELAAEVALVDGRLRVELVGPDEERCAAHGAELLEAFEHLLRRALQTAAHERLACEVDCRGQRASRQGELESLARAAAAAVRKNGRPVLLDPLPPAERRIVHQALSEFPDLESRSVGEGADRRVEIRRRD